jgi:4-hydroxy-2-oxoheptanedioate aldolase
MPAPTNHFKARLKGGDTQLGLWLGLGEPTVAEVAAQAGFDWLVVDAEHGPNHLRSVRDHLRVIEGRASAVVRPRDDDRAFLKQLLDVGAQTILIPMVESGKQAREAVRSVLYPPAGVRGIGAALARASGYSSIPDYLTTANDEICLLVQVESRAGLDALDDILATDGLDGVFIGPADLAADLGHIGKPGAPEVQAAVVDALTRIRAAGKAAGILTSDRALAQQYAEMGVEFLAIGSDTGALVSGLKAIRDGF